MAQRRSTEGRSPRAPETAIREIVERARDDGVLDDPQASELLTLFGTPPGGGGSGLDDDAAGRFAHATLELLEKCLFDPVLDRRPFVNPLVQEELDRLSEEQSESPWRLSQVSDTERRGTDRRFTFGQVKTRPDDPLDPSFFCGSWLAERSGEAGPIVFVIRAEAIPQSVLWTPIQKTGAERAQLEKRVRDRGPHASILQVEPTSPLGGWIAGLAGTNRIGQHKGEIPLGVLAEAVRRTLEPRGLTHLLLGMSRRDPTTRPWHTGAFLKRLGESCHFAWEGLAIDASTDTLVRARCTIAPNARIVRMP